jgi:hypothetical protein
VLLTDAERRTRESIEARFDALSVELLGARGAGLSRERLRELIEGGQLDARALEGLDSAGGALDEPLNPWLFIRLIGTPYFSADPATRARMRDYTLERWVEELAQPLSLRMTQPPPSTPPAAPMFYLTRPEPPPGGYTPTPEPLPLWVTDAERAGLVSAYESAGRYIRGLGAQLADEAGGILYEEWAGERLIDTPNAERRARALEIVRDEIGTATLTKDTAETAARRIRQRTGDLARNFERIATTELQATHNEGQVYQALYLDGDAARVARIPESGACKYCRALFLTREGLPRVFDVEELAANGTNVGRAPRDYLATAYPVHPQCRCDIIPVRAGQRVDERGRLIKEDT